MTTERGLPTDTNAERFVLGSILLNGAFYLDAAASLKPEDFSLDRHRCIFRRMGELQGRGETIERLTVVSELGRYGELEACGGLSYIVSLDDGLPEIPNLDAYIRLVEKKAVLRRIVFASQNIMNRVLLGEEDPAAILAGASRYFLDMSGGRSGAKGLRTASEIIDRFEGGIDTFLDPSKRPKGISTGFSKFDEMTGGMRGGDLIILAARPSMGKTALALNIAHTTAVRQQRPTAIFSLEMSEDQLLTRMMCSASRVDSQRFRCGYLVQEERRKLMAALQQIHAAPLEIDDTAGINLADLHAKVRRLHAKYGDLGLVVVDYLQLMGTLGSNRNEALGALSRGLKLIAKELNVPMLVLSQLSRAVESRQGDHRPIMSDLRESGNIEQDADIIAFVFREEYYHRDREDLRGLAELIVAKQRNGPVGTVNLVFLHAQTRFENRADDIGDYEGEAAIS